MTMRLISAAALLAVCHVGLAAAAESGGFVYDTVQQGPILGAVFRF